MTDSAVAHERRRFKRIAFDARTELKQGPHSWAVQLLDLSLKGLLVEKPVAWESDAEQPFVAEIHLGDEAQVEMQVQLAHDDHGQLGFRCENIELESIGHLRRVIELNLGDPAELEREFAELIQP
ncbi:PilZ domain-containing protein [Pseudomonas sp. HR96]|uniref:PilZ domain-containing protein n=1 Tax=Pseudomonas sp. HR96 TaxID=1027966 RepID=UPI002A75842F|nr:PilZ domain-containing protein [Pseudomonas sp. HR96]WPO99369.1 PilZ domain-containing protein [Pseudomonas sp. HR96]